MLMRWFAFVALMLSGAWCSEISPLFAEEISTDAERCYRDLHDADNVKTKLLAERWYNVIKLQEWTNGTGQFTATAKYLDHDPDLAWVKLRIIQGTGEQRVVKDVTIPTAKLSKTCQSRVRQISVLTEKVSTAANEMKQLQTEKDDGKDEIEGRGGIPSADPALAQKPRSGLSEDETESADTDAWDVSSESLSEYWHRHKS